MLFNKIKESAKLNKVKVFFDMDGVLVEYRIIKEEEFDKVGFYEGLRPLKTNLAFAKKLSKIKNVEVCILSNCRTKQHKTDKLKWLKSFAPFFKQENINIICYEEIGNFDKSKKSIVKSELILEQLKKEKFTAFHIEDDTNIIKIEKAMPNINIIHVSSLIK